MRRFTALVSGRVQGVGFRDFVMRQALAIGLTGTVRNIYFPRRIVEVVAEGPEESLQRLLKSLYQGPPMSRVEQVDVTWESATAEFDTFAII